MAHIAEVIHNVRSNTIEANGAGTERIYQIWENKIPSSVVRYSAETQPQLFYTLESIPQCSFPGRNGCVLWHFSFESMIRAMTS